MSRAQASCLSVDLPLNPVPVPGHGPGDFGRRGAPGRRDHQFALGGDREADALPPGAIFVFDFQVF